MTRRWPPENSVTDQRTIEHWQTEAVRIEREHGFADNPGSFGDRMALLHSEVSEAFEAWRKHGLTDLTAEHDSNGIRPGKPEGVGSEFADIAIRLLTECARYGIDLRAEVERKMAYNERRPFLHGGKSL